MGGDDVNRSFASSRAERARKRVRVAHVGREIGKTLISVLNMIPSTTSWRAGLYTVRRDY
jgi:hypothetical protein